MAVIGKHVNRSSDAPLFDMRMVSSGRCACMPGFATLAATTDFAPSGKTYLRVSTQGVSHALETFLAGVERKGFRIAQIALRHEADALDAVQDAMLQLSVRYG